MTTVVDSLRPLEIVVSFSSLSYWYEPPIIAAIKDEVKSPMKSLGVRDKNDRESRLGDASSEFVITQDTQPLVTANTTPGSSCLRSSTSCVIAVFAVVVLH